MIAISSSEIVMVDLPMELLFVVCIWSFGDYLVNPAANNFPVLANAI